MSPRNRLTQTLHELSTLLFRCGGLAAATPEAERPANRDVAVWVICVSMLAAWYFFVFDPVRERNAMLRGRLSVLTSQCRAEQTELARVQREVQSLRRGQPQAWERAARLQLGFLKPGETTDLVAWRRQHPEAARAAEVARPAGPRCAAPAASRPVAADRAGGQAAGRIPAAPQAAARGEQDRARPRCAPPRQPVSVARAATE